MHFMPIVMFRNVIFITAMIMAMMAENANLSVHFEADDRGFVLGGTTIVG
jgi:hypothetical protein